MTADELYQQAFRNEIAALRPASLCDIGCGSGALVAHVRSMGIAAVGIEPDAARTAEGRTAGLDLREGKAEALPFQDAAFDLVTFENSLHHVTDIGRALAEAMRVARRAIVIVDPWFDLSIPTQAACDRFERWLKRMDRMTGMVHWDPIPAGQILGAVEGASRSSVRHLLYLTPLTAAMFENLAGRIDPAPFPAYKAENMDQELIAIRTEYARVGMTDAGSMVVTIVK